MAKIPPALKKLLNRRAVARFGGVKRTKAARKQAANRPQTNNGR